MPSQRILRSDDRQLRSHTGRRSSGVPSREPQLVAGRPSTAPARSSARKPVVELERRPTKKQRIEPAQEVEAEVGSSEKPSRSAKSSAAAGRKTTSRSQRAKGKEVAIPSEDEAPKPKVQRAASSSSKTVKPKTIKSEQEEDPRSLKRKFDKYAQDLLELDKREYALAEKEEKLKHSTAKLEKLKEAVKQREREANDLVVSLGADRTGEALAKLDECFTCALCFDIMACPYSLVPSQCGHTFCALCILKWFFSHLHYECGNWHEILECPLCRAHLPFPLHPDQMDVLPRPAATCPFTPNRLADKVLTDAIDVVRQSAPPIASSSTGSSSSARKKKKAAVTATSAAAAWSEGGDSLTDWQARDRKGRTEMAYITRDWSKLKADHFRAIKDRLAL
ncbi:hypothetical protein B0H21DRAFT_542082 [Amylocystis lapponica]|nr:hypothetical protein B0H21DRAFT_542082 [Amylocystis lapponica]